MLIDKKYFENFLFLLCFICCCWVVLWKIADFPIYFFCDEATFSTIAIRWIENGWRDSNGNFLPIYHNVGSDRFNPALSSYLMALPYHYIGASVTAVRSFSALIPLSGVIAISLYFKLFFQNKSWWIIPLIFASISVWYLHSRTVFEVSASVGMFCFCILFYGLYRIRSAVYIYPLVLTAAAFFYSYSSSQIVLPAIAIALLITDFKYHCKNCKHFITALLIGLILSLPAVLFVTGYTGPGFQGQFLTVGSHTIETIPLLDKLILSFKQYITVFSPTYWLAIPSPESIRHQLLDRSQFPQMFVPFLVTGLIVSVIRVKNPAYRILLICGLCIPLPMTIFSIGITRVLTLTVILTSLTIIGFDYLISMIRSHMMIRCISAIFLAFYAINMSLDAVKNGGLWYNDYSMYGLQFGTRHIFEQTIPEILQQEPDARFYVTSNFANDPTSLVYFFFSNSQYKNQISIGSLDLEKVNDVSANDIFVETIIDFERLVKSGKFKELKIIKTLNFPNGQPGFYFFKALHVDNIQQIIAAERAARNNLIETTAIVQGQNVKVRHSMFDLGQIDDVFDSDLHTLARGKEANPIILEIELATPSFLSEVSMYYGGSLTTTKIVVSSTDMTESKFELSTDNRNKPIPENREWHKITTENVKMIRLEILNPENPGDEHHHLYDLQFKFK